MAYGNGDFRLVGLKTTDSAYLYWKPKIFINLYSSNFIEMLS